MSTQGRLPSPKPALSPPARRVFVHEANSAEPLKILYFVTHVASIQAEPRQRNSNLGAESPGSTYGPEVVMA